MLQSPPDTDSDSDALDDFAVVNVGDRAIAPCDKGVRWPVKIVAVRGDAVDVAFADSPLGR